jgi:PEP-CTERM/exosortase A-associated glycosyltransferase
MKILHVLDHSIPLHSGYTFRTLAILRQQAAMGYQTCHVTSPKHGNQDASIDEVDGLRFYRSQQPQGWFAKLPLFNQLALIAPMRDRILETIALEKPDVIHAHSPALNGLAALAAAKITGLPLVYEVRAFWEDAAVDHGTCQEGDLRYRLTRAMESYVLKRANAITTICEGLRQDIVARGIAPDRITPIPNAVNVTQFPMITEKDSVLAHQLGLEQCVVLGFIGSFYAYEGLDLLVAAMPKIIQQIPNARLLLVGGGPQADAIRQQVQQLGLGSVVIMPGRVPHHDVNRYYSLLDLLVYPRKSMRLTELVTPLKPLEAMAQGKLLLASDIGGHRELIKHGTTGWLCQSDNVDALAEAAISLLQHPESWPMLIANGREFVETQRNWSVSVANYAPIYQALCGKSREQTSRGPLHER